MVFFNVAKSGHQATPITVSKAHEGDLLSRTKQTKEQRERKGHMPTCQPSKAAKKESHTRRHDVTSVPPKHDMDDDGAASGQPDFALLWAGGEISAETAGLTAGCRDIVWVCLCVGVLDFLDPVFFTPSTVFHPFNRHTLSRHISKVAGNSYSNIRHLDHSS